jgi:hypothetical protein
MVRAWLHTVEVPNNESVLHGNCVHTNMKNLKSSLRLIKEQTVKVYGRVELLL